MPGATPKKAAAKKAAAPKVQAATKKAAATKAQAGPVPTVGSARLDLTDALALDGKPPVPITFQGIEADIRRAFTGEEVVEFFNDLQANRIADAIMKIVGPDAMEALWEKISALPPEPATVILNRLINLSELTEGEAVAPLPASPGMDGAQRSQGSSASTD